MTDCQRADFVPLSDVRAVLGESPVWSPAHRAVWWVDIDGRRLMRTALDGTTGVWETPEVPGFVQCLAEEVLVGMQTGIFRFDATTARFDRLVAVDAPGQRFNDACTDSTGRIWAGTMDLDNRRDVGVLYLFDPRALTLTPRLDGFRTINGLAWDAARQRLYLSDSHPAVQTVWHCRADPDGTLADRTHFVRFHDLEGRPDGAALDDQATYWIAGIGGGTLYRFAPDGAELGRYAVPMQSPTKPALIATPDGTAMVLTSREDDGQGGRLSIWCQPPIRAAQPDAR